LFFVHKQRGWLAAAPRHILHTGGKPLNIYLPLSSLLSTTSKHTKCSKKQQNEKGHQVVPNETNKQKLYCALTQRGKFPSRFSVHGLYALQ